MPKISFTKVESILSETLLKMMVEKLNELATIITLVQDSQSKVPDKVIDHLFKKFQGEFQNLKTNANKIYMKLALTSEEETKFLGSWKDYSIEDWNRLKLLKEEIDHLRKDLYGSELSPEAAKQYEEHIEQERLKHINKRFNIRDGWLPLR